MKLHNSSLLVLTSLLLNSSVTLATSLNLFKLQPISNFPTSCTAAYNSDISDCTFTEISRTGRITSDGQGVCSAQCIDALSVVNSNLNGACVGVMANPTTLIGLFFNNRAVNFLCPNNVEGNGPAPTSTEASSSASSALLSSSSEISSTVSSKSSSSSPSSSPSSTDPTSTTTTRNAEASTTKPTTPPTPNASFQPTTAANNGIATIITSEAQRTDTAQSNPDAFGGGGSPFEVAANAASSTWGGSWSSRGRRGGVGNYAAVVLSAVVIWGVLVGG